MAKQKTRARFPVFWICLLVFVALVLGVMVKALAQIRVWLVDYEAVQPKYAAAEVFRTHFADPDYAALADACPMPANLSPLETKAGFAAELEERFGDAETSYAATTPDAEGNLRYLVKAGEQKIAIFSLVPAAEKSRFGFTQYTLGSIELYIRPEESVAVRVPAHYEVRINGTPLTADYLTEDGIPTDSCEHMPEGLSGITYAAYAADCLLRDPTVEVLTPDGTAAPLTRDPETGEWQAGVVYDAALKAEYSDYIIGIAQNYAAFVMKDAYFSSFSGYFDHSTDLYQTVRQVPTSFVWRHDGFEFADVSAEEFYSYSEDVFSCRVRFMHILHRIGSEDYTEQFDVTFYLHRVDGKFLIYDMVNN